MKKEIQAPLTWTFPDPKIKTQMFLGILSDLRFVRISKGIPRIHFGIIINLGILEVLGKGVLMVSDSKRIHEEEAASAAAPDVVPKEAATPKAEAPKGPKRPLGVGLGDLFFSDSE